MLPFSVANAYQKHQISTEIDNEFALGSVAIVGMGYVGLPTALSLAAAGAQVHGFDVSEARLDAIRNGEADMSPLDRRRMVGRFETGMFRLGTNPAVLGGVDAVIVSVPTPIDEHLAPDLTALRAACATVVAEARPGQTIVLTSTTYVGCTRDLLVEPLAARGLRAGIDVFVCFAPERINPGSAEHAPEQTPRVIGGETAECVKAGSAVLAPTCAELHEVSSLEVAEMAKLLENTFRAVNVAMANEFADAAASLGVPIDEVIDAASTKPYGFMPFRPGPGVGGHCIPCDPHYLLWQMRARREQMPVIEAAMTGIAVRPHQVVRRVREELAASGRPLAGSRVHMWGVTYKPGVADVRASPAIEIFDELIELGAIVTYSDPRVPVVSIAGTEHARSEAAHALEADLVVTHTVHPEDDLNLLLRVPRMLDTTYRLGVPGAVTL